MDEEKLHPEVRRAIIDRFDSWDLVDLLDIPISQIVDAFEELIVENLREVLDYGNIVLNEEEE